MSNLSADTPEHRAVASELIEPTASIAMLDEWGAPRGGKPEAWWRVLSDWEASGGTASRRPGAARSRMKALALLAARFARPDGSSAFEPLGPRRDRLALMTRLAEPLGEPGLATVARWWSGGKGNDGPIVPPPLPAFGHPSAPLAVLRADWGQTGDLMAIDAREPSDSRIEVMVGGRPLLGPTWPGMGEYPRLVSWTTSSSADCVEWSSGTGVGAVARLMALLRCRGLAIVAEERHDGVESRIALAPGVAARPIPNSNALRLRSAGSRGVVAVPLWAPEHGPESSTREEGSIGFAAPGRAFAPWLLSWHESRARKLARWRPLTVSEQSKAVPPEVAFAARAWWGPGDGLVVYRSLEPPARRTFLGYQTEARFVVGLFDAEGNLKPLLSLD